MLAGELSVLTRGFYTKKQAHTTENNRSGYQQSPCGALSASTRSASRPHAFQQQRRRQRQLGIHRHRRYTVIHERSGVRAPGDLGRTRACAPGVTSSDKAFERATTAAAARG